VSGQHTQGRLHVCSHSAERLRDEAGEWVADTAAVRRGVLEGTANARRLAACWNACEGISTEELEGVVAIGKTLVAISDGLMAERDQLRAELATHASRIHNQRTEINRLQAEHDARQVEQDEASRRRSAGDEAIAGGYMALQNRLAGATEQRDAAFTLLRELLAGGEAFHSAVELYTVDGEKWAERVRALLKGRP
jgi:hypothetical protein